MSTARVDLLGMDAFRNHLRSLPEDLKRESSVIVEAQAREAARDVQTGYPEGPTGNLKRGVTVQVDRSGLFAGALVRSRAPHASLFESGTKRRETTKGANRGVMPKPPASQRAIPKFIRARARMTQALIEVVRRAGFEVDA